ncbi:MAG: hypothetical protein KJO55_07370, partial [Gammaproteobacteria bacterium]|nr:hypothetical protein [Gammaproteobacteria bacterium]
MTAATDIPAEVLQQWQQLHGAEARRIDAGLINDTFKVSAVDGTQFILQRVHPVFKPDVTTDIQAISDQLKWEGMTTQSVVP